MQLLTKRFKNVLCTRFRATLNFRKFQGGSEPHVQNFFKVASDPAGQQVIVLLW